MRGSAAAHTKNISRSKRISHTSALNFPVPVTQPRKTHPQITSPRRKQLRRSLSCPKTHKFPLSSHSLPSPRHIIQHSPHRHPTHRFISHCYYYYNSPPISLSLFSHPNPFSHPTTPKMDSAALPNPGVPGQSKYKYTFLYYTQKLTNSIYLVIGVMLLYQSLPQVFNLTRSLPPLGVYLHEGGCNFQVGINIVSWFFFITPCTLLPTLPYTDTDNSLCPRIRSSRVQETLSKNQTLHRRSDHKPHRRRYLAPSADLTLTEIS